MNIRTVVKAEAKAILSVVYRNEPVNYWRVLEEIEEGEPEFHSLALSTLTGALNAAIRETGRTCKGDTILPPVKCKR